MGWIQGSSIWNSEWREARARNYGVKPEEIEELYRKRNTLKVNVTPPTSPRRSCGYWPAQPRPPAG